MDAATALIKRKADEMALMPPPAPSKRIKRPSIILDEDVYTDALSKIIARDFFPGLLETKAQQEYLDAVDSKNQAWIKEAGQNLVKVMTPGPHRNTEGFGTKNSTQDFRASSTVMGTMTPGPGQTPYRTPSLAILISESDSKDSNVDISLSLSAFHAKYTSEDNESFNELLDEQNRKRANKYAYLRDNTNNIPSKRLIAWRRHQTKSISASDSSQALIPRPSQDLSDRPSSVSGFAVKQGSKNSLMFSPNTPIRDPSIFLNDDNLKKTNFSGTRLQSTSSFSAPQIPESPSLSAVDAAISGHPRRSISAPSIAASDYDGSSTPAVNGYKFVDEEPTVAELQYTHPTTNRNEIEFDQESMKPYLPTLPSSSSDPHSNTDSEIHYKPTKQSEREALHYRIVERLNARNRHKSTKPSDEDRDAARLKIMSPAGRMLAHSLSISGSTTSSFDEKEKRAGKAWTPMRTPIIKR